MKSMSRIRIALATASRFHLLDLARELYFKGYEVDFYSFLPRSRARSFGLPDECHVDLFPLLAPTALWQLKAPRFMPDWKEPVTWRLIDRVVAAQLRPCDVFICMSGIFVQAAEKARSKYGARLIVERASKHVLVQQRILLDSKSSQSMSSFVVNRELKGYEIADLISVPSSHVAASFDRPDNFQSKIVKNPYGVDLKMFPVRDVTKSVYPQPVFVFAGTWSKRKGCDILIEVMRRNPDFKLLHAGLIGDVPAADDIPNIHHLGHLDQTKLVDTYHKADAFVLASREEGFGLVLSQALAAGLPVVCTEDTGGPDLRHTPRLSERITLVETGNLVALETAMHKVVEQLRDKKLAPFQPEDRRCLSWEAYAERYSHTMHATLNG